jgi:hypothetical protein
LAMSKVKKVNIAITYYEIIMTIICALPLALAWRLLQSSF